MVQLKRFEICVPSVTSSACDTAAYSENGHSEQIETHAVWTKWIQFLVIVIHSLNLFYSPHQIHSFPLLVSSHVILLCDNTHLLHDRILYYLAHHKFYLLEKNISRRVFVIMQIIIKYWINIHNHHSSIKLYTYLFSNECGLWMWIFIFIYLYL